MYKRKKNKYEKKLKTNLNQKENSLNQKNNYKKYKNISIFYLIDSIIKEIYYIIIIIILKIYFNFKIAELSHRGYLWLLFIDTIVNGGSIYYIIYFLIKFYELYSPFNQEWSYLYVWIICTIQLLFFFISFFLFLMKYIYIKIFFCGKFKILFFIFCIIAIIFNFSSLNDLNNDKYSFQIQNFEIKKLANYKKYFRRNYVNLYLNKNYDVGEYELCFEMQYPNNFTDIIKNEPPYSLWSFEKKNDFFVRCRNISFKDNPSIDNKHPLSFFKCDTNNNNVNILPNYCITAEQRRKKYNFIYHLNVYEFIILIVFYIYEKIIHYIFNKYHLYYLTKIFQEKDNSEIYEENEDDENEGEVGEDKGGEEEEYEDNEEEQEEEQEEEEEEIEETKNWGRNKYRKISKKKMKYYKKKQKNRFRKYHDNNQNENNLIKEKENEEQEKLGKKNDDKNLNLISKKNNINENKEYDINENKNNNIDNNINNNKEDNDKNIDNENTDNKKEDNKKEDNSKNMEDNYNYDNTSDLKIRKNNKKNSFIYQLFIGGIVDKIKNKFYNILKEIDKEIKEDEKNF